MKQLISEKERTRITNLYEIVTPMDYVIYDWLSPDEKYVIFLDELYDVIQQKKIGNIWENFDNFKMFIQHSFEVSTTIPQQIKEELSNLINSFVITESTRNLSKLKPIFKQILEQENKYGLLGDFGNWAKDTATNAISSTTDFFKTGYEGLKKMGIAISQGEWSQVVDLLKKGSLYVARRIRAALYNPVGLILDAILVASGVGVGLKMLPWAIVVGLDLYEFGTGNYEEPDLSMGWRLLFFAVDCMGLVLPALAAKGPRVMIRNLINKFGKTDKGLLAAIRQSKPLQSFFKVVLDNINKVSGLMQKSTTYLKQKSPKIYNFLSGSLGLLSRFLLKLITLIKSLLKGVGFVLSAPGKITTKLGGGGKIGATANTFVPLAGLGTYQQNQQRNYEEDLVDKLQNKSVESEYDPNQI
jgi:hypothetical protein